MNTRTKGLLLAGLLAAAPACAATVQDTESVEASADELKAKSVYFSQEFAISTFNFDTATNKSVKKLVKAKLRVTIAKAGQKGNDYRYDGNGVMAHEFKIEWIDRAGLVINSEGETYYAKATGTKDEFRLYDCASTNNCSEESYSGKATVRVSPNDRMMTISGLGLSTDTPADDGVNGIRLDDAVGRKVTLTRSR